MKKILGILLISVFVLSLLFIILTPNPLSPNASGHTADGIITKDPDDMPPQSIDFSQFSPVLMGTYEGNAPLTRMMITYEGDVFPSMQTSWYKFIDGTTYIETLTLKQSCYNNNQTFALYEDILTAQ